MKHVWILNHYAQQPGGAGWTRHYALARHLPKFGWTASIIASSVEHNSNIQRLSIEEDSRLETHDDVRFLWLRCRQYSGNGFGRIRNMIDYTRAVLRPRMTRDLPAPDLIVGSSVHPFAAWAGRRLARRHGVPFIFEVRDLWPQTLIDMGHLSHFHPIAVALRKLEKSLYRSASRIIVLLPLAAEYIEPMGIPEHKIVWISNGVDLDESEAPLPWKDDGKPEMTFMYFGAHGEANGLDNVLRAMRILAQNPEGTHIRLRLIGDGPRKLALIQMAEELELDNVSFEDPVPKSLIPSVASEADAFVFNLIDAPVFKFGISSNKLFDFMAAQRPVIFCCRSGNNPIEEAGAGITVEPENPEALADAMLKIAHLPTGERAAMGMAGRSHVEEKYTFQRLSKKFAETLDAC